MSTVATDALLEEIHDLIREREQDGVAGVALHLAGYEITAHDAPRLAVDEHQIEHLTAREHLHHARVNLAHESAVATEQQLLPRLPARVERARDLCTPE